MAHDGGFYNGRHDNDYRAGRGDQSLKSERLPAALLLRRRAFQPRHAGISRNQGARQQSHAGLGLSLCRETAGRVRAREEDIEAESRRDPGHQLCKTAGNFDLRPDQRGAAKRKSTSRNLCGGHVVNALAALLTIAVIGIAADWFRMAGIVLCTEQYLAGLLASAIPLLFLNVPSSGRRGGRTGPVPWYHGSGGLLRSVDLRSDQFSPVVVPHVLSLFEKLYSQENCNR